MNSRNNLWENNMQRLWASGYTKESQVMKQRRPLEYGYRAYNGTVWCDYHIDRYNALQEEINKHTRLAGKAPESLLDESHKMFCRFSEV